MALVSLVEGVVDELLPPHPILTTVLLLTTVLAFRIPDIPATALFLPLLSDLEPPL